jgi:hypothetical protein
MEASAAGVETDAAAARKRCDEARAAVAAVRSSFNAGSSSTAASGLNGALSPPGAASRRRSSSDCLVAVDAETFELVRQLQSGRSGSSSSGEPLNEEALMDLFLCLTRGIPRKTGASAAVNGSSAAAAMDASELHAEPTAAAAAAGVPFELGAAAHGSSDMHDGHDNTAAATSGAASGVNGSSLNGAKLEGISSRGSVASDTGADAAAASAGAVSAATAAAAAATAAAEKQGVPLAAQGAQMSVEMTDSELAAVQEDDSSSSDSGMRQLRVSRQTASTLKVMADMKHALQLLHEVDGVLEQLALFWANTEVIFDLLLRKGDLVERFVAYAHKPRCVLYCYDASARSCISLS